MPRTHASTVLPACGCNVLALRAELERLRTRVDELAAENATLRTAVSDRAYEREVERMRYTPPASAVGTMVSVPPAGGPAAPAAVGDRGRGAGRVTLSTPGPVSAREG